MTRVNLNTRDLEAPGLKEVKIGGDRPQHAPAVIIENAGGLAVHGAEVLYGSEGAIGFSVETLRAITQQVPRTAIVWFQPAQRELEELPVKTFQNSKITVDTDKCEVILDDSNLGLTNMEYRLLYFLARREGVRQSHQDILLNVWGDNIGSSRSNTIAVHVSRIRKKLGSAAWTLSGKQSMGYMFTDEFPET